VVAEGAMSVPEAEMEKKERKAFRANAPSIGYRVAREIEDETGLESRLTVLGYVQRGGSPSPEDRLLSTLMGSKAAHMIQEKEYGRMVALKDGAITSVPLEMPADKIRYVAPDEPTLQAARSIGTCFGDGNT